ncbi:MAG: hypothetical protein JNK04_22245 [Myxococcales bacterium]|nr:hypothetical protein [Myxococcales bacterium]
MARNTRSGTEKAEEIVDEGAAVGAGNGELAAAKTSTVRRLRAPFALTDSDAEVLSKVLGYYHADLLKSPAGLAFLEEHRIAQKAVPAFRLGIASRSLGLCLPHKNRVKGRAYRTRLAALGLLRDSGHEQLRGAIVVPLVDAAGAIVNLYGCKIEQRYGGEHFFSNDSRVGLFNVDGLERDKPIVIAGTVLDALSVWSIGSTRVTSLQSTDGPLEELLSAVRTSGARRVTLALPRTAEFVAVTSRLTEALAALGIEVLRAVLPGSESANDVLRAEDGAYKLGQLLRAAEWVGGVARVGEGNVGPAAAERSAAVAAVAKPSESAGAAGTDQVLAFEDRQWRIRGLAENLARGTLKLNVFVWRDDIGFHVDSFDLYSARHRKAFLHQAAIELGMEEAALKKDLGQVLLRLEQAQEAMLEKLHAPEVKMPEMKEHEREDALELLRDPRLIDRILGGFAAMGIVGERENLLVGYLVAVSRKLAHPLGLVIQSSSAAGKTALLDAILSTVPEEERFSYAAVSGQSLYYMGKRSLRHRLLSIAEDIGSEKATHALKLLHSSKELTIASTGKDGATGRIASHEYKVEGPVALMITTSKVELDEELHHRCLVLSVDESPAQTKAVQEAQRQAQTLEGMLLADRRLELEQLHKNAQRLLRPLVVVNPHIDQIAFEDRRVRARSDHRKLLSLIEAITLLHQHQRPLQQHTVVGQRVLEYIEATAEDIALAQELLAALTGSATGDLPPRTAELLTALARYVDEELQRGVGHLPFCFTRRDVREALGWGDTQLKTHLRRLVDAELVIVHRAVHGRGIAYELAFDADDIERSARRAGPGRAVGGPRSALGRVSQSAPSEPKPRSDRIDDKPRTEIALGGLKTTAVAFVRVPKAS